MLCLGPADPLAAHLHVLSSTALCHRVPGFVPGSVPPRNALFLALYRCAGGSYPSDPTSPVQSTAWERGSQRKRAAASWNWSRIGMGLLCPPKGIAESFIFRMVSARPEMRARDSRHRAASAGLFAPAGEPASRGTVRAMRMGCVCSVRQQQLPATWNSAALVACACRNICTSCDPIEVTADTNATGCHGPAHHGCSAAGSRRTASARSGCIGSIMRAPSFAIDHHRSKPSPQPILHRATELRCVCEMPSAATRCTCSRALFPVSDPTARSALRILEEGKIDSVYGQGALGIRRERQVVLHWVQHSCA